MTNQALITPATSGLTSGVMRYVACGRCRCAGAILMLLTQGLHADTLVLKNGQTIVGKTFARQGDAIVVTAWPNGEAVTSETGTPLADILKVECEPPMVLSNAPALLAVGKTTTVLADVEAALKGAETLGDLPGSYWPDLLVLRAQVMVAMGKDAEAATLARAMTKTKNVELVRSSQVLLALLAARKGNYGEAADLLGKPATEPERPATMAAVAVTRGLGLLAKQQFTEALKAFLELPVFLPDETALSGVAQLGAARAYYGMEDYDRAIAALTTLIKTRPGTSEIATAQTLLPEWQRRRRAVEEAKDP